MCPGIGVMYGQQQNPFESIIEWRSCINDHEQGCDAK
jgi:hypothetical protein